jgi:hypothetical protein
VRPKKEKQVRGHGVVLWIDEAKYAILERVAERDRRFPTSWAKEALLRALKRAVRDEAAT